MNTNNENNLLNQPVVSDISPFSHLDFPNHLSCIIWFIGCNLRCDYCYNKDIVFSKKGTYSQNDVLHFLSKRIGLLDGVVLSGGEATNHNLIPLCQEIKKLGFKIKLDTNGLNPQQVSILIKNNLIDYIALDYKSPKEKFFSITHSNKFENFQETLQLLIKDDFDFEVRTTIHRDLLDEKDINNIIEDLFSKGYKGKYFLQDFFDTKVNIGDLKASEQLFDRSKLSNNLNIVFR